MTQLVGQLHPHEENDALGQKLLALTVPGVPDVYQGTELWDDSLVDPDNRRPVDYTARRQALKSLQHPKVRVVAAALRLRRARPAVSCAAVTIRCSPAERQPIISWRSAAVTTSWSPSPAGRSGSTKPAGATR
ncbi:maltooligosyl trehalose synthase domain protein [Mycobacterium xenopi 3993]|nr:maltooligosyl trehalose synthase domain protein [Mycobacterium xenopi 3993]